MPTGFELVCFPGQTGSERRTVTTTRLTHFGHHALRAIFPARLLIQVNDSLERVVQLLPSFGIARTLANARDKLARVKRAQ
jgi:hypothetical protein